MRAFIHGNIVGIINLLIAIFLVVGFVVYTYFFFIPDITLFGKMFYNPVYYYFEYMPWFIYALIYIAVLAAVTGIILLISSMYYIKRTEKIQKKEKSLEEAFSKRLIYFFYNDYFKDDSIKNDHVNYFKRKLKGRIAKGVFLKTIVYTQDLISEDFRTKINELLEKTDIKNRVEYYLYSYNTSNRILALKIISLLGLRKYDNRIQKFIKSRNFALRNEAVLTWVKLSETNNLDFLFEQKNHISSLAINSIFNAIDRNLKADQIDYNKMMSSGKDRVSTAGAMLLKDANNREQKDLLKANLDRKDTVLREVAWESYISTSHDADDITYMLNRFHNESQENKVNILKALQKVKMDSQIIGFLDKVILNESMLLKIVALRLVFNHNMSLFFNYQQIDDQRIALACREVTDFNIV